ncbi:MAG: hypothetical protein V3T33_09870 [Myxococcota bacterium]
MGLRHKRNLTAWLQNYRTENESFTPLLFDQIMPVVLVDDQRFRAPIGGDRDRLQVFSQVALDAPVSAGVNAAVVKIVVRDEGLRFKKIWSQQNEVVYFHVAPAPIVLVGETALTPRTIRGTGGDLAETVFTEGELAIATLPAGDTPLIRLGRSASGAETSFDWGDEGLPVPAGQNIFIGNTIVDAAFDFAMWIEFAPRR